LVDVWSKRVKISYIFIQKKGLAVINVCMSNLMWTELPKITVEGDKKWFGTTELKERKKNFFQVFQK
jgi:hypothetical protein